MPRELDSPPPPEPPLVYPSPENAELWIVERPASAMAEAGGPVMFTGPNALNSALRFAYEEYGSARFFPFPKAG
jgi:hypothetical protein